MAIQAAANHPSIAAVPLISPVDFGGMVPETLPKDQEAGVLRGFAAGIEHQGSAPLSGCTPDGLARDILVHAAEWNFATRAAGLRSRPVLLMTSDDGWTSSNDMFVANLQEAGSTNLTTRHLPTDHSYSDQRTALSSEILRWLSRLPSSERQ